MRRMQAVVRPEISKSGLLNSQSHHVLKIVGLWPWFAAFFTDE
jgi:hypothetical protein